jgi:hypothetical protein
MMSAVVLPVLRPAAGAVLVALAAVKGARWIAQWVQRLRYDGLDGETWRLMRSLRHQDLSWLGVHGMRSSQ